MSTMSRWAGAVVGFAVGDAVGAQLLGLTDPEAPIIAEDGMAASACTEQLVIASRALLAARARADDPHALRRALADELVAWYHRTDGTAHQPSATTLAAAARLAAGMSPAHVANPDSDAATAVLRAVPVGLVHAPELVWQSAHAAVGLTHRHPNAVAAGMGLAWLVSRLARGAPLDRSLIGELVEALEGTAPDVLDALRAALEVAQRLQTWPDAIDEADIPCGDGGVRAASALGHSVAIALHWAPDPSQGSFEAAIEQAARTRGAGDVVASLTGAILGAAWGLSAIPRPLVERLSDHDALVDLSRALHAFAGVLPTEAPDEVFEDDGYTALPQGAPAFTADGPDDDAMDVDWLIHERRLRRLRRAIRKRAEREAESGGQ